MIGLTLFLCTLALLLFIVSVMKKTETRRRMSLATGGRAVPGPKGLPFVGHIFNIDPGHLHQRFGEWAETYGPVVHAKLFGINVIYIHSSELLRKAFDKNLYGHFFNERPMNYFQDKLIWGHYDIAGGHDDEHTRALRILLQKGIHKFGDCIGTSIGASTHTEDELKRLVRSLENTEAKDVDPKATLFDSLARMTAVFLTGDKPNDGDSDIIWGYTSAADQLLEPACLLLGCAFPLALKIPVGPGKTFNKMLEAKKKLLSRFYDNQLKSFDVNTVRGFVDFAINELNNVEASDNPMKLTEKSVKSVIQDIVAAGLVGVAFGLYGALLTLLHYRDAIKKIQMEIDDVIGRDRIPNNDDRSKMPYTSACIVEFLRFGDHATGTLTHVVTENVLFEGYCIEKGSIVFGNLSYINHDAEIWNKPWTFNPNRFLDEAGQLLPTYHKTMQAFVSFGVGQRKCPGDDIAKSRFFLCLTSILQRFDLKAPEGEPLSSCDPKKYEEGVVRRPHNYLCRFVKRQ